MAELISAAGTGDPQKFFEALRGSLSGFNDFEDSKNILPVAYQILAEKLAEADRTLSATKNDAYLSIPIKDEVVIRSESVQDRLSKENVFIIDRIGTTASTELFAETQTLTAGTTSILLSNVPSDPTNIKVTNLNSPIIMASQVSVQFFDSTTNSVQIRPLVATGFYKLEYATTGDVFIQLETKTFGISPNTQISLINTRLVFGSEKIFPVGEVSFVRDIDYVINYLDGVVDFLDPVLIQNRTIEFQYSYQRDLLETVSLFSHVAVRNEIATPDVTNPLVVYTKNQPIQDVTRVQNITTTETYSVVRATGNEVTLSGNSAPARTITNQSCTESSKVFDFANESYNKIATVNYPESTVVLNHPLTSLNSLTISSKAIRLSVANQIITGKNSTVYRRVYEDNLLSTETTSVVLDFIPVNFAEVVLYRATDITKTNLIAPTTFNSSSLELTFVTLDAQPLSTDDYIVRYDTLQWLIYCGKDVSTLQLVTGGVLLRNATKRLKETVDYTLSREATEGFRVTFTAQGAANVGSGSSFYTLIKDIITYTSPVLNNEQYVLSYREALKNEIIQFTSDPLDQVLLLKLERFRDRGQTADVIVDPVVRVFSQNGQIEYIADVDFEINYANKTIRRIDNLVIDPLENVVVFYEDNETVVANFTYVSDIVQIDYEYGDNAVDWSPTIVDTSVTQLEALQSGTCQLKLNNYPASYKDVQISNTLYPEIPAVNADGFDPITQVLSFPSVPRDGTYLFKYTARQQIFNEGIAYYVSYRYGARRDRLHDFFAYLYNVDIGQVFRQDLVALMSDQVTQELLYHPLNFYDVKIYAASDNTQTPVTKVINYNYQTNLVTFEPVENAGQYVFEYYTFNRDVEQLRKGLVGLSKSLPLVPTVDAFVTLMNEFTVTVPEIENVSDKRFQIRKRIKTTEATEAGQTYLTVSDVSSIPKSGTAIIYGSIIETVTYSFLAGKRLEGIPINGYGALTQVHPVGSRVIIQNNTTGSFNLNPLTATEAEAANGVRAIKFVPSLFGAGVLCGSALKGWVRYPAMNNVNIKEGTLSFWTGTKYDGNDGNTHYYIDLAKPKNNSKERLSIYKSNKGYLQFEIRDNLGRLMSIRVDVRRGVTEETLWLDEGQTEVALSQVPSYPVTTADVEPVIIKLPSGAQLTAYSWDRETKQLLIDPAPVAGYYFFSYVTGFVNFDETEHFIEATWKIHTDDGTAPRLRLYVDGVKHEQRLL